ncbi:universal stress protein [Cryptosporangium minutisporangium]|uniref:Universal stress protein n=1 Tax=Cryptosporangium minutisporangium TaxID=113569 RepID=A0ABP6T960_9ACTN
MSSSEHRDTVVVGTDGSPHADIALQWALRYAEARQLAVRMVTATEWPAAANSATRYAINDTITAAHDGARRMLDAAVARSRTSHPSLEITGEVSSEAAVPALLAASENSHLLVVGRRGLNPVMTALLGSVSTSLVNHAHCPVAVIHEDRQTGDDRPVVAGLDGSKRDLATLRVAFDEAARRGAPLVAAHAWSDVPLAELVILGSRAVHSYEELRAEASTLVTDQLAAWRARYPDVTVQTSIHNDQPAATLIELGQGAGLLVVGSHGRGGFAGMVLGSVARRVVHHANCPVIVVRGEPRPDTDER